jgi:hypothetical protein
MVVVELMRCAALRTFAERKVVADGAVTSTEAAPPGLNPSRSFVAIPCPVRSHPLSAAAATVRARRLAWTTSLAESPSANLTSWRDSDLYVFVDWLLLHLAMYLYV